ncbi:MAG TPA: hypothetical protein PL131_13855 [Methylotenera sp.]|nr:hypothetical protein [Methylotenera sp.]HPN02263.1 hypothetical protein [Methylotenera sp.]
MPTRIICIFIACLSTLQIAYAAEYIFTENADIQFVEEDSADCSIADGKLIAILNTSQTTGYQVWVDRWFMDVQTPDHTKQILLPNTTSTPLGCSMARGGGKQHWTIYSVEATKN